MYSRCFRQFPGPLAPSDCVGGEPEISMYVCSGIAVAEDQMYVTFWTYCIFVIHGEFGSSVSAFCDDERDYCRLGE